MMQTKSSKSLYLQIVCAVIAGILLGHLYPKLAVDFKPLGDIFIRLIKMMVAPIIFVTIAVGIAKSHNDSASGFFKLTVKAIVYFEVVTVLAMLLGLAVGMLIHPGAGMNVNLAGIDTSSIQTYKASGKPFSTTDFLLGIVPTSFVEPFLKSEMLQVLFISVLVGFALSHSGSAGRTITEFIESATIPLFKMVGTIMRFAPVGAFGALAFTVGKFGIDSLKSLAYLVACFYLTSAFFITIVLGTISRIAGFNLWKVLRYFKDEALIVFACASNEAVFPALVEKMERLGCSKSVVGLALPMSYALNLDGACIYYTLAITFMAQALNIHLTVTDLITIFAVLLLTSKGSATVAGGGFVTLAATLATVAGKVPVEAMILLVGVDRFMSEARSLTNFCGNLVATLAISRSAGAIDMRVAQGQLDSNKKLVEMKSDAPNMSGDRHL